MSHPPPSSLTPPRDEENVLAVVRRRLVLDAILASSGGAGIEELITSTGLKSTTVRYHVDALIADGLVSADESATTGPGRPRLRYLAVLDPEHLQGTVAQTLSAWVDKHTEDPAEVAAEAAHYWASARPLATSPNADIVRGVSDHLTHYGFAPEVVDSGPKWRVLLHRCPLAELAHAHPRIACGTHLGLLRAALEGLASGDVGVRLEPFVAAGVCAVSAASGGESGLHLPGPAL